LIRAVKGEKGLVELAVAKPFRILNPGVAKAPEGETAQDDHADDDDNHLRHLLEAVNQPVFSNHRASS
jgi:hypothetical protein